MFCAFALFCIVAAFLAGFAPGRKLRQFYGPANLLYLLLTVIAWYFEMTGLLANCAFVFASALFVSIGCWEQMYEPSSRNHMRHFPTVIGLFGVFITLGSQAAQCGLIPPTHSDPFELFGGVLAIAALLTTAMGWGMGHFESAEVTPALQREVDAALAELTFKKSR